MTKFSHLHVHTQFSILDSVGSISSLYKKAVKDNMPAIAITDHGNMFGVFKFVAEAAKYNTAANPDKIKPIVGCEFYLVEDRNKRQFARNDKDVRYHQLLLVKNPEGYKNLMMLCSLGYTEGLYGKYPRIDKELIVKYHKGLIATTCCFGAIVPQILLSKGEEEAEKEFKWWFDIFGEDFYVEIQRHGIPDQNKVNTVLLKFAKKYNVKVIASNDVHYVEKEDANAHDILLCIKAGELQSVPKIKDYAADTAISKKGKRLSFYNDEFYFKTTKEMTSLFGDLPQAIDNTNEIVDKVVPLKLKQDILLPNFQIPITFLSQDDYLHHLTFTGAKERYRDISPEAEERLNFELNTIRIMGFAGYFLIVADFIKAGRDIGVFVGPGRGSAAGSAVAYCMGITNIDPIKYNLLFERFLNPDRRVMPEIDTDFDYEGRQKIIDYVVGKYGKNQVAEIVSYGKMATKTSIRDVANVLELPDSDTNTLIKLIPDNFGFNLTQLLKEPITDIQDEYVEDVNRLREIVNSNDLRSEVLKEASIIEGSIRGTGIHASAIIIAPKDLTEIIPVFIESDSEMLISQYDGSSIEDAGVFKINFLGLQILTVMKNALRVIMQNHGVDINIDTIPLDDRKTFALFQQGNTDGIFQFSNAGMKRHLICLKPDQFSDLVVLNALYRPGAIEFIPSFIASKHNREPITYSLPEMEEYLNDTYGVMVYQEQVMLLAQKLGGFSKAKADLLRKAMGKKDRLTLDKMKIEFLDGAIQKGFPVDNIENIWLVWEKVTQYSFCKSHSMCYTFLAFQTAYLKAHYPEEYMDAYDNRNNY